LKRPVTLSLVIIREGGRSSIPETAMIETTIGVQSKIADDATPLPAP
jgi:hypothetical protein